MLSKCPNTITSKRLVSLCPLTEMQAPFLAWGFSSLWFIQPRTLIDKDRTRMRGWWDSHFPIETSPLASHLQPMRLWTVCFWGGPIRYDAAECWREGRRAASRGLGHCTDSYRSYVSLLTRITDKFCGCPHGFGLLMDWPIWIWSAPNRILKFFYEFFILWVMVCTCSN